MEKTQCLRQDEYKQLISFGRFLTNYDVTRVERKTAEPLGINSSVQKRAQNREKTTSRDYSCKVILRAKQVDEPAETELVHVVDGGQVVPGKVQLHCKLSQVLKKN